MRLLFFLALTILVGGCSEPPEVGIYAGSGWWNKFPSVSQDSEDRIMADSPKTTLQGPRIVVRVYFGREISAWDVPKLESVKAMDPWSGKEYETSGLADKLTGKILVGDPKGIRFSNPERIVLKAGSKEVLKCIFYDVPPGLYILWTSAQDQRLNFAASVIKVR